MRMRFMMSCKEATEISNRIQDNEPVGILKKMEFKFHIAMCKLCAIYNKQNIQLNDLIGKLSSKITEPTLTDRSKIELKEKLKNEVD